MKTQYYQIIILLLASIICSCQNRKDDNSVTTPNQEPVDFTYFDYYNYGKFEVLDKAKESVKYNKATTHLSQFEKFGFTQIEPIGNWTSGDRWYWIFKAEKNQELAKYYLSNDLGWFKEPIEIENSLSNIFNAPKLHNGYLRYTKEWYDEALYAYQEDIPFLFDVYEETVEIEKIWELLKENNMTYTTADKANVDPFVLLEYFVKNCNKYDLIEVRDAKFGVIKSDSEHRVELFRKGFIRACYNIPPDELYK